MENRSPAAAFRFFKGDPIIWGVAISLAILSLLVVYSATGTLAFRQMEGNTEYYLFKHGFLLLLCLGAMWVCHRINYRYYSRLSRLALLLSVPLLLLTWGFGTTINEATRWITIPFINQTFQAADLAKLALIANTASMLSKRQKSIQEFQRAILPILFWCGLICGLIALTDLSGAALLFATCMVLLFVGRVPVRFLASLILIGAVVGFTALKIGQRGETFFSRIESFLDKTEVPFQAQQSYIAVSTGGVMGKGPGKSDQKNVLPHPYSDFIFAIIVEEYGMMGGLIVLVLYLLLLYRGMLTAQRTQGTFAGLLSAGLSFSVVMQALVHMGVVVGLFPITGLPLPMLSMGGTSLLFTGVAIGILLAVSRGKEELQTEQVPETENSYQTSAF